MRRKSLKANRIMFFLQALGAASAPRGSAVASRPARLVLASRDEARGMEQASRHPALRTERPPWRAEWPVRHGERTKAAIAEQRKFSALLKMLRAGLI